uniref:E3 ubiquitin-protein ligase n=1 Tax=Steinernema glaseri TaxID=37863 RepID=A0A1I8AHK8_9BILA
MRKILHIKCRKCREMLLNDAGVLENVQYAPVDCCDTMSQVIAIVESEAGDELTASLPGWIVASLEKSGWTKGKLNCPKCAAKVGSFGFIGGTKCTCRKTPIPSIYLVRSSVDVYFLAPPQEQQI